MTNPVALPQLRKSEDDPPPLLRGKPLLSYPGVTAGSKLDTLEKILQKRILDYFQGLLAVDSKRKRYHGTQAYLANEYEYLNPLIERYLTLTTSEPIRWGKTVLQFVVAPPLKIGPTVQSLAKTQLYRALARDIDGAEASLTNQQSFTEVGPEFVNLDKLAEHLAWRRIVRVAITSCLIRAFDYKAMWGTVDGDAGWWLHANVIASADTVVLSKPFSWFQASVLSQNTFLDGQGVEPVLAKPLELKLVRPEATQWRQGCQTNASPSPPATSGQCVVSQLGKVYPGTFAPLERELFSLSSAAAMGGVPPNMFTRPAAQQRVQALMRFWEHVRERLIAAKTISNKEDFKFTITAANLRHGGWHPPHIDHKDGSMFDMVPVNLPHVKETEGPAPMEVVFSSGDESPEEDPEKDDGDYQPPPRPTDWEFPASKRRSEWETVATRFTECIYLTFPDFVIYAREKTTVGAKDLLLARIGQLAAQSGDDKLREKLAAIRTLVLAVNPTPWERQRAQAAHKLREGHADHWHVNYRPDWLGDEGPYVSLDQDGARARAQAFSMFDEGDLWASILDQSLPSQ